MPIKDYLPRTEAGFIVWLQNFVTKLPAYVAALGITPAQVTQFQTDLTDTQTALNNVQASKTSLQSVVQQKDTTLDAVTKRIRDSVVVMKRNTSYTEVIGEDLGVVPAATLPGSTSTQVAKPTLQALVLADKVRLDWVKGASDGVVVQSKRGAEAGFTTLSRDTVSPYDDERLNLVTDTPETRTYRMRYLSGDEETGLWSDEAKVVCVI